MGPSSSAAAPDCDSIANCDTNSIGMGPSSSAACRADAAATAAVPAAAAAATAAAADDDDAVALAVCRLMLSTSYKSGVCGQ